LFSSSILWAILAANLQTEIILITENQTLQIQNPTFNVFSASLLKSQPFKTKTLKNFEITLYFLPLLALFSDSSTKRKWQAQVQNISYGESIYLTIIRVGF
jgi:hypothetical protein